MHEHFGEKLKAENKEAWREGNNPLYEYYKASAKELPDTLEEMAPLFAAVHHGCQAGRYQEVFQEVFWKRIRRGQEAFSWSKLGAFGSELTILPGFFDGASWQKPVDELLENIKSFFLNAAGFHLRALGRLVEATPPMQASLEAYIAQDQLANAARIASNLSELYLILGDVKGALAYAEQSVQLADKSSDEYMRVSSQTTYANVLHHVGRLSEAEIAFREAEEMQKVRRPQYPLFYGNWGFYFCGLLISLNRLNDVEVRASQSLKWGNNLAYNASLLDIALDNLSLGCTKLLQAQREPTARLAGAGGVLSGYGRFG